MIDVSKFLHDNFLSFVANEDGTFGFLSLLNYKLPFPDFPDPDSAVEYVIDHPIPVALAVYSVSEHLSKVDNSAVTVDSDIEVNRRKAKPKIKNSNINVTVKK